MVGIFDDSDAALLSSRDPEAFGVFYSRHVDVVAGYFRRRTPRAELVLDLTAETFARALARRATFDADRGPGIAWLLGIARNLLVDAGKAQRVADDTRQRLRMERRTLDDEALAAIDRRLDVDLDALLRALPDDQRSAVRRRIVDDESYAAIAADIACSEHVVRKRVSRGLATLRRTAKELR